MARQLELLEEVPEWRLDDEARAAGRAGIAAARAALAAARRSTPADRERAA